MDRDEALMAVRLGMQVVGGSLTTMGIGNAGIWEAATGLAVMLAGYLWSRRVLRQRQVALAIATTQAGAG